MERRKFILASLTAVSTTSLISCAETTKADSKAGTIIHSVYFWLKEGITAEEEADFLNFFETLRKVPDIQTLEYGKPAPTHPRPVVDNSFSFNLIVTFANMNAIDVYENHPIHLAAIEKYQKYWTKVEVRDTQL